MAKLESVLSIAFLSSVLMGLVIAVSAWMVTPSQVALFNKPASGTALTFAK